MTITYNDIVKKFENNACHYVFIEGAPGTGKSHFINHNLVGKDDLEIVAPTGLAAANVSGVTIHSFFKISFEHNQDKKLFKIAKYNRNHFSENHFKILAKIKTLVIDEISMVRADIFDCINETLQDAKNNCLPFGGVHLILVGDLKQIPPVIIPAHKSEFQKAGYRENSHLNFQNSKIFPLMKGTSVQLKKIYRNNSNVYNFMMEKIRAGENLSMCANYLNQLSEQNSHRLSKDNCVLVVNSKSSCKNRNDEKKQTLNKIEKFRYYITEETRIVNDTNFSDTSDSHLPADRICELAIGARVVFLKNASSKDWHNGSLGSILDIHRGRDEKDSQIKVKLDTGKEVFVPYDSWKYSFIDKNGQKKTISYHQIPLKFAYAFTYHKTQGISLDKMLLSPINFVSLTYVGLTRLTDPNGLILERNIESKNLYVLGNKYTENEPQKTYDLFEDDD